MNYIRSLPVVTACIALFLAAGLAEAAERKCVTTASGVAVILGQPPILVLNGQNVGTMRMQDSAPQTSEVASDHLVVNEQISIPNEDILSIQITCMEFREEGRIVGRQVIAVVTRSGAVEFMRSYLQALSALQEEHRTRTGTYAASLSDLNFFAFRAPLPIVLAVQQDEWSARVELDGFSTSCSIQGGQRENVVRCGS